MRIAWLCLFIFGHVDAASVDGAPVLGRFFASNQNASRHGRPARRSPCKVKFAERVRLVVIDVPDDDDVQGGDGEELTASTAWGSFVSPGCRLSSRSQHGEHGGSIPPRGPFNSNPGEAGTADNMYCESPTFCWTSLEDPTGDELPDRHVLLRACDLPATLAAGLGKSLRHMLRSPVALPAKSCLSKSRPGRNDPGVVPKKEGGSTAYQRCETATRPAVLQEEKEQDSYVEKTLPHRTLTRNLASQTGARRRESTPHPNGRQQTTADGTDDNGIQLQRASRGRRASSRERRPSSRERARSGRGSSRERRQSSRERRPSSRERRQSSRERRQSSPERAASFRETQAPATDGCVSTPERNVAYRRQEMLEGMLEGLGVTNPDEEWESVAKLSFRIRMASPSQWQESSHIDGKNPRR